MTSVRSAIAHGSIGGAPKIAVETTIGEPEFVAAVVQVEIAVVAILLNLVLWTIARRLMVGIGGTLGVIAKTAPGATAFVAAKVEIGGTVLGTVIVVVLVLVFVVAPWLLGGAVLEVVETAQRTTELVTIIFEREGAVVGTVVRVVVAAVAVVVVMIVINVVRHSVSEKKHLVDNVDDSIAGQDVRVDDFRDRILAVAIADLEDIIIDAFGGGSAIIQHSSLDPVQVLAGTVLEEVGTLRDVVLEDFCEQGLVVSDGRRDVGREIGKGIVGGGKDGILNTVLLVEHTIEVGIFQQATKGAQAWSGTGETRNGLALRVVVVAVVVVVAHAQWLLGGTVMGVVDTALGPSVLGIAFVVKGVGAVVGSN